jgi:uncharacterized protein
MKYFDRVYGEFEIDEPVILNLVENYAIQRLKGIDQAGYYPMWIGPDDGISELDHSRFAHSMGVFLLLRQFNASIEEQIAGLIHDVSHSAFSHCIDYVLDVGSEQEHNHQDNVFKEFFNKTELPEILNKYGIDPDYILDEDNFPLEERELPDLCADRIDYSLRTAVLFGELSDEDRKYLLNNLTVENNYWLFKDYSSAERYAELFLELNTDYYAAIKSAIMFRTVGDCMRYALKKGYIIEEDLYKNDKFVLDKIRKFMKQDRKLESLFNRMNNNTVVRNDPDNYDAAVFCKSRVVDPLFKSNGQLKRVSEGNPKWGEIIEQELRPKQYFLKFED